jgi:hypothetical protein
MPLGSRSFVTRALASLRICFPSSFTPSTSVILDAYWRAISTLLWRLEVVEIMGAFVGVVNSRAWVGINVNANFLRLVTCSVKVLLTKGQGPRGFTFAECSRFYPQGLFENTVWYVEEMEERQQKGCSNSG